MPQRTLGQTTLREDPEEEKEEDEGSRVAPVHFGANPHCVNT